MPLTHLIAHHLQRGADAEASAALRSEEFTLDERSEALHAKLKGSFLARLSREHGSFADEQQGDLLPQLLARFLDGELDFTTLSRDFSNALQTRLNTSRIEFNAHLLFAMEKSFDNHLFTLFVARQSESITLDSKLEITPAYTLDHGPSLFGIKVDLQEWRDRRHYAYLSLLPPRGNPALAEAFYELTGFNNGIDKEATTLSFLEGVEAYARELPPEQHKGYRDQVVEYCMAQEQQDAPVRLGSLAQSVEGINPEEFVRIVTSHTGAGVSEQEAPEVVVDRRALRRYVKFAGREKDLAISFSSYQLDERVRYDADNDTLHITGLPKALKKQLLHHLRGEES